MTNDEKEFVQLVERYRAAQLARTRSQQAIQTAGAAEYLGQDGVHRITEIGPFKKRKAELDRLLQQEKDRAQTQKEAEQAITDWLPEEVLQRLQAGDLVFCSVPSGTIALTKSSEGYEIRRGATEQEILEEMKRGNT